MVNSTTIRNESTMRLGEDFLHNRPPTSSPSSRHGSHASNNDSHNNNSHNEERNLIIEDNENGDTTTSNNNNNNHRRRKFSSIFSCIVRPTRSMHQRMAFQNRWKKKGVKFDPKFNFIIGQLIIKVRSIFTFFVAYLLVIFFNV